MSCFYIQLFLLVFFLILKIKRRIKFCRKKNIDLPQAIRIDQQQKNGGRK